MPGHTISLPFVGPKVEALLLWRNPINSATVLGAAVAIYAFVALSKLNTFALLLRVVGFGALLALAWATGASTFGRAGPPVPALLKDGIKDADVKPLLDKALPHINQALGFLGVLAGGKNAALSLKVVGGTFAASWIIAIVPPFTFTFVVVLLAFTLPKAYELKKDEADALAAKALEEAKKLYAKFDEAVLKKIHHASPVAKKAQ